MAAPTRSLKVYNGSDATPVTDVTDRTDWPGTELSVMANAGEAAAGTWLMRDETGTIPDFLAPGELVDSHNVIVALVGSNTLFRGRIAADEHFRGRQKAGRAKEISFTLEDQNSHLRGIIIHEWIRPAETDAARAQALVAAYLSGAPRATTNLNGSNLIITGSNAISLPAKTYSGVTPYDVMQELASNADKEMFVSIDNDLAYFGHDYTGYVSLLRVSDDPADQNANTYPPINPHGFEFGRQKLSALRVYYGSDVTQSTVRVSNALEPRFDYWEDVFWDSESVTPEQAEARAQKMLDYRSTDDVNYTCSIGPLSGDDIWKIKPGQQINFKSRAARGGRNANGTYSGDNFLTTRVRQINWTMPAEDIYFARLEIERPKRTQAPGTGNQALATQPRPAPETVPDTVVNPTTIYHALFTTDNKDEETHTYAFGFVRTAANSDIPDWHGGTGGGSDLFPISPNTVYAFRADVVWGFTPANRDVLINWRNAALAHIGPEEVWIDGSGHATHTYYSALTYLSTSPPTAAFVQLRWGVSGSGTYVAGISADNIYIETPGSVVAANNDPYALPDPGNSPYYMKSDDPRVLSLIDQMATVGFSWKQPVLAATTTAGTLASSFEAGDTIDGVTLEEGNRILIKDQASGAENGIYLVNVSGAPTRAVDFVSDGQVLGAATFVSQGTVNADKVFVCTTNSPITVGSTVLAFAQVSGGGLTVQEDDSTVDAAVTTLDFRTALNVTSSPSGEANVSVDLGTASTQAAAGDHTHTAGDSAQASGTGDVTTTTSLADVTGASLSLVAGTYTVVGVFDTLVNNALNDRTFEGHLDVNGSDQNDYAQLNAPGLVNVRATLPQVWRVTLGSTQTIKLRTKHSGGTTGDFTVKSTNTSLAAWASGQSHGAWTDYTPTWTTTGTAPAIVNGTLTGRYKLLDANTLVVHIVFIAGSSTTFGTGTWAFALPQAIVARNQVLTGWILDSGTDNKLAVGNVVASDNKVVQITAEGANVVTNTVPQTWASGDQLTLEGILEV